MNNGHLTVLELLISGGAFAQIIAALVSVIPLFSTPFAIGRRSWSIFAASMAFILVRRTLSIWRFMGFERWTVAEIVVAMLLSLTYIGFVASVLWDIYGCRKRHGER